MQNGATAIGQDTEKVSDTSSAKQKREEKIKNFDIEFETRMRLEQAWFEWLKKARAGNANEGTENQASTARRGA